LPPIDEPRALVDYNMLLIKPHVTNNVIGGICISIGGSAPSYVLWLSTCVVVKTNIGFIAVQFAWSDMWDLPVTILPRKFLADIKIPKESSPVDYQSKV
jgi:hypothetical protein